MTTNQMAYNGYVNQNSIDSAASKAKLGRKNRQSQAIDIILQGKHCLT